MRGHYNSPCCATAYTLQFFSSTHRIIDEKGCLFDLVVKSQDFHPQGHISFASTHNVSAFSVVELMCLPAADGSKDIEAAACCLVDFNQKNKPTCTNNPTCGKDNRACAACGGGSPDPKCKKMKQTAWPDHCLQGPSGDAALRATVKTVKDEIIVQKGDNKFVDAYVPICCNAYCMPHLNGKENN